MSDNIIEHSNYSDKKDSSSSKRSKKSSKKSQPNVDSDDINDISQMADIIANKKKTFEKEIESHITESSKTKSKTKSDYTESIENEEDKKKKIKKENENEFIRKEKSEYLCKFNRLKNKEKWTSLSFDMNSSLEEIKNEFDRVTNAIKVDRNVQFYKKMLLLGVQGVEMMNSKFDPLGVDLDGWSEAMTYNMDNQEYDDVMA